MKPWQYGMKSGLRPTHLRLDHDELVSWSQLHLPRKTWAPREGPLVPGYRQGQMIQMLNEVLGSVWVGKAKQRGMGECRDGGDENHVPGTHSWIYGGSGKKKPQLRSTEWLDSWLIKLFKI